MGWGDEANLTGRNERSTWVIEVIHIKSGKAQPPSSSSPTVLLFLLNSVKEIGKCKAIVAFSV